jgi:hypothetical protein
LCESNVSEGWVALVVAVHGIGQELLGVHTLLGRQWLDPLRDGLKRAHGPVLRSEDVAVAFYGDLYRPRGTKSNQIPDYDGNDVDDGFEEQLLLAWWQHAAEMDEQVGARSNTKGRTPHLIQEALEGLCRSRYFGQFTPKLLVWKLKQVGRYFSDSELRTQARERVRTEITPDTRVVVGHSLGSVVAYEALCSYTDSPVRTLVSLGSPLGIRNLIFDRLDPLPRSGMGVWPGSVETWTNIADQGDVVALYKQLRPLFGEKVRDIEVHNGATAHDVTPYLTAVETGHAIAAGLAH